MKPCRTASLIGLLALLVAGLGCSSVSNPSDNRVVTLTGTLEVRGLQSHPFTTSKNGEFRARVMALAPNQAAIIGLFVGQPAGSQCAQTGFSTTAGINSPALTGPLNRGNYCLGIADPGTLTTATTYTVELSHP